LPLVPQITAITRAALITGTITGTITGDADFYANGLFQPVFEMLLQIAQLRRQLMIRMVITQVKGNDNLTLITADSDFRTAQYRVTQLYAHC
jgi:hypothetical protein